MSILPGIGGLIGLLITAVVAAKKSKPEAGKMEAEADLIRVEAQAKVIDGLTDELRRKDEEIAMLRAELVDMRHDCERLQAKIVRMEKKLDMEVGKETV